MNQKKFLKEKSNEYDTIYGRTVSLMIDIDEPLQKCVKPVITSVHSNCIGAGIDLVTAADIRYASKDALFSIRVRYLESPTAHQISSSYLGSGGRLGG